MLVVLRSMLSVLAPPRKRSLSELAADGADTPLNDLLADHPGVLPAGAKSVADFETKLDTAEDSANEAIDLYLNAKPGDPARAQLAADAEQKNADAGHLHAALNYVLALSRYADVQGAFEDAKKTMFFGALTGGLALGVFAWATHPEASGSETSAATKVPVPVELELSDDGREMLGDNLGARCDLDAVRAIAIGGSAESLDVVTVQTRVCGTVRFTLTSELGTFQATEPVLSG